MYLLGLSSLPIKDIIIFLILFNSISFLLMSHSLCMFLILILLTLMLICGTLVLLITLLLILFILILRMNQLPIKMIHPENHRLHNPFKSIINNNNQTTIPSPSLAITHDEIIESMLDSSPMPSPILNLDLSSNLN